MRNNRKLTVLPGISADFGESGGQVATLRGYGYDRCLDVIAPGFIGTSSLMNILVSALIRVIEAMFIAGILGSFIVVLLTSIEDFKMLFEKEPSSSASRNNQ
jgi:hypothetical protein